MNPESGLILDTHVWIWWVNHDSKLPASLRKKIHESKRAAISAVSLYELNQAVARGRLRLSLDIETWIQAATEEADIDVLSVNARIASIAGELPQVHGDPLDRFIIATALSTGRTLVSMDRKFQDYKKLSGLLVS